MGRRLIAVFAPGAVLFGLLAFLAHNNTPLPGDEAVTGWLMGLESPSMDVLMRAVSFLGDNWPAVVTVAILALIMLYKRRRLEALFIISVPALAGLLNYLMKHLVDRSRPGADPLGGGLSFPSGHATYALVFFGFLCFITPRFIKKPLAARLVQAVLVMLIILTGAARIYLGAHWPSDVWGSFIFGGLLLVAAAVIYDNCALKEANSAGAA